MRTSIEEKKHQDEFDKAHMRTAFTVLYDIMKARKIEYPFAVIWQTFDEHGNDDYLVMSPCGSNASPWSWNENHGKHGSNANEIANEHLKRRKYD